MSAVEQPDDRETSAAAGDTPALQALLTAHLDELRGYVVQHTGAQVKAREGSVDLVQSICREVLEDVAQGRVRYLGDREFRAFLFATALNKIRSKGRFHGRLRRRPEAEVAADSPSVADALFAQLRTPSASAADREERERFSAAFAALSEQDQLLIQWSRIDGLSHREIAGRLGIKEGYSRTQLGRALARLSLLAGA